MKEYEKLIIDVIEFESDDIITESGDIYLGNIYPSNP